MAIVGSKRERHRQNLIRRASRRRPRESPQWPAQSTVFPWYQASGPLPRWMFLFGVIGVGLAVVGWVADVLVVHHWI